jgi:hypothetical protein
MPDDPDRSSFRLRYVEEAKQQLRQGLAPADVVKYLHGQGLSVVECIWVMSTASGLPLESAKNIVLSQPIWNPGQPGTTGGTP